MAMANGSAPKSNDYDVFLSHGSPDKAWVRQLHARLEAAGVTVFRDEVAIEAGDNWVRRLSEGIERASTLVLVISRDTLNRPWVEQEWTSFMATHGPGKTIIPVILDQVELPSFLRPFQAIHAVDRNIDAVAALIARAVGKGNGPLSGAPSWALERYTGPDLIFTLEAIDNSDRLAVTSTDGTRRTVTAPWRDGKGHDFVIGLRDFEQLTRASTLDSAAHARLIDAAQTVGTALFDVLFSEPALRSTFVRATAPGRRAVVTVQSDDDVLLSLPWELLFNDSRFLVRDGVIDVVRSTTEPVKFETQLAPPSAPFTVVTHVSAPEGSALSYEGESYRITHALTDHCGQTATELGTLEDLVNTVTREKPRGIHFSGHGSPGELVFEDEEGFEDVVPIERVVTELRKKGDGSLPPFFFLASCHGNTPAKPAESKSGSSSSAAHLHRASVVEVVGYFGPIVDELSTRAEETLYAAIAAGEPTRLAVAKARAALERTFDDTATHRPAGPGDSMRSSVPDVAALAHTAPFAWAQLVFYHRGPEHPLGTPASPEQLRERDASLTRTYRDVADRVFLDTGFIGRRRELHQLRRRRKRGDRVFVLQGLGGLGKTTLAGHLLASLADERHCATLWCRRSEREADQAESLVGQLLTYARARFGTSFEQIVSAVDRAADDDAAQRFAFFLQAIIAQQPKIPLVVYFDNLESLLHGPDAVSLDTAPDADAFGAWRSDELQRLWRVSIQLAGAVKHLYVVASCRYRNDDLMAGLLPVSPLADVDLFRLMAWFPALRRLSTRTRGLLVRRLSGHPRAVEFLDALIAESIGAWESSNGDWTAPASNDDEGYRREWDRLVSPVLPDVQERIWSDLLLAALWNRVIDARAQRMLFRMTLLRRPWVDELLPHLADAEDDAETAQRTARALAATSLLEQITLTVTSPDGPDRRLFYTVHAATAAFIRSRVVDVGDLVIAAHRRVGTYLEEQARTSLDLSIDIEAGYHLFEAGEYDRAFKLLAKASVLLRMWGRVRESLHLLLPFRAEPVLQRLTPVQVSELFGTVGIAHFVLGQVRLAIEHYERTLAISREIEDLAVEGNTLGNLGLAYAALGEVHRAIESHERALAISRKIGDRRAEGQDLGNLGNAYHALGDIRHAIEMQEQALVISREVGDLQGEGHDLGNLATSYQALGDNQRAIEWHEQALVILRKIGDRRGEGRTLGNLGLTYAALGNTGRAIDLYEQQLVIVRQIGDRRGEGNALTNLGIAYATLNDTRRAIEFFELGLSIDREIGDRLGEGASLSNLGNAYLSVGEFDRARDAYGQGLAIGRATSNTRRIAICEEGLKRCADALRQQQAPQGVESNAPQDSKGVLAKALAWARRIVAKIRAMWSRAR